MKCSRCGGAAGAFFTAVAVLVTDPRLVVGQGCAENAGQDISVCLRLVHNNVIDVY